MFGMDKNLINMNTSDKITRKMLSVIRENHDGGRTNKLIKEDTTPTNTTTNQKKSFPITKNTPQFGDVRETQEQTIVKTIGERITFEENALVYYPDDDNMEMTGKINALNLVFQFRYNDSSGDGCYIWANALQLTDVNNNTIGKIRDAFEVWRKNLTEDGDLISRLHKVASGE